jgi:hypothetical protein
LLSKLDAIKTRKIQEQQHKKMEMSQQRVMTSKLPDMSRVTNEAHQWKHKADEQ